MQEPAAGFRVEKYCSFSPTNPLIPSLPLCSSTPISVSAVNSAHVSMGSSFHSTAIRKPAFPEDEGLASISDLETGFSGNAPYFLSKSSLSSKRNGSCKAFSSPSYVSAGSGRLYDARIEDSPYFLDACYLCKKPLGVDKDIFMYRGDTPFCSKACRQEQIDIDEAKEKNWSLSMKVASRKEQKKSPTKNQNFHARTGTVVAG